MKTTWKFSFSPPFCFDRGFPLSSAAFLRDQKKFFSPRKVSQLSIEIFIRKVAAIELNKSANFQFSIFVKNAAKVKIFLNFEVV